MLKTWIARFLITRAARAYGFLDPVKLLAKMRGFAQPSEVAEPVELLRAGMIFHARGLVNTKAIQNNLDWIWPYWVERQFNPGDESFIPRAFSFSHINLTHRNWTAVGLPDVPYYPIVDPRGLVTPLFDAWSIDLWLVPSSGALLLPSKLPGFAQEVRLAGGLAIESSGTWGDVSLFSRVEMRLHQGHPRCEINVRLAGEFSGWVAVSIRPYNPEGISFIDRLAVAPDRQGLIVNGRNPVRFDHKPDRYVLSMYTEGDVSQRLREMESVREISCPVGMATGAALFSSADLRAQPLKIDVPIYDELSPRKRPAIFRAPSWQNELSVLASLHGGEARMQRLYDTAVASLVLHTSDEVFPGPYTYKRFWYRDAVFILNALLCLGGIERTRRALEGFPTRQRRDGYFLSQEGEWDSNGEALWMFYRFARLAHERLPAAWLKAVERGARWIAKKRLPDGTGRPEAGLLPAGFSAEHLGPNDFYYWDDFWGVAGLRCAAELLRATRPAEAAAWEKEADDFLGAIEHSFPAGPTRRFPGAIPASPKRRMDSGAVGSLVADYPLQLFPAGDSRILKTADYLRDHSSFQGGFFQNMIHSGINPYLTLHLAQVRLRAGQMEAAWALMDHVAALASSTGQWPEAIHPHTGGGCMGDGQHIWAAAEWVLMVRNCFVREEGDRLVIGAGVKPAWWRGGAIRFGPTLTPAGAVTVSIRDEGGEARVALDAQWQVRAPEIEIRLPGFGEHAAAAGEMEFQLEAAS